MHRERRRALKTLASLPVAGLMPVPSIGADTARPPSLAKLKLLVLGGTHYLGPAVVRAALARNHQVTLFNRGETQPQLFPGVEKLRGNRFPEKAPGLRALEGSRTWDVVIDLPAYYPRLVAATARLLRDRADRYIVMSSISVYQDFKQPGLDEESAVRAPKAFEERAELIEGDWSSYGARKAECEKVAAEIFGGRSAAIRASGIVGGASDDTTRYWPARIARGGKVLAPGDGSDAYQTVDVNDVASLVMLAAELRWRGPWNATGPATPVTFGDYLQTCMRVTGTHPELLWLDAAARERFKVQSDETPQWAPSSIVPGFQRISSAKARAAGWSTRSLEDSVRSTWLHHRENFPADYDFRRTGTGFSSERERTLLEALAAG